MHRSASPGGSFRHVVVFLEGCQAHAGSAHASACRCTTASRGPHSRRPRCRCRCAVERAGGERLLEAGLPLPGARDRRSSRGVHQPAAPCRSEGAGPRGPARARQALRDGGRVHLLHPRRCWPPDASCASVSTGTPWRAQLGRSAAHTLHSQGSGAWSAPLQQPNGRPVIGVDHAWAIVLAAGDDSRRRGHVFLREPDRRPRP